MYVVIKEGKNPEKIYFNFGKMLCVEKGFFYMYKKLIF